MSDLVAGISAWFSMTWNVFTSATVPGLDISFATLSISLLLISGGFTVLGIVLNRDFSSGQSYGSSGSKKIKVSKERRGDTR